MVSKFRLFDEKVERDLELESFQKYNLRVSSNIIGVFQVQKRNKEKRECEKKEKKRKQVKGDQHIKGCGNQIFKSKSRPTVKKS